jgi:dolichol-phosphate mannosyltransferase
VTTSLTEENILSARDAKDAPLISLVIPTFNEAGNIAELLAQLSAAMPEDVPCEVIFVDDSTDDTPRVITEAARDCRLTVSVRHRETPDGGLGGAVAAGLREATAPWIVVMDADLQHPPSLVPELVAAGQRARADLVVASRYINGGGHAGLDGGFRVLASGLTTRLAKLAFWRQLRQVSDPMSGFFAIRSAALNADVLRPLGYKILLELIVRCRLRRVTEVPYQFRDRFAGESKASFSEGWRFLRHLMMLRCSSARGSMLAFGLIGLSGIVPNLATLWLLSKLLGMNYLLAEVLANQVAIAWNFLLLDLLLFHHRRHSHWTGRFGKFLLLANSDLVARIPLLGLLVAHAHMDVLVATAITLIAAFGARYVVTDRFIYLARPGRRTGTVPPEASVAEVQ